jgi:hypothetical protein
MFGFDLSNGGFVYNLVGGVLGILLAAVTLWVAYSAAKTGGTSAHRKPALSAQVLAAVWTLVPPIFLWADWVFFCNNLSEKQLTAVEHTHDLARNIWLGLTAIIVYAALRKA